MPDIKTIIERIGNIIDIHKYFRMTEIGEIGYDDYSQSVLAIESHEKADTNILITAGIHGDEPAGTLAAIELLEILTSRLLSKGYTIIPYVNPWGSDNNSRVNGMNLDVNRDFRNPKTQEATVITRYLSSRKFDLVLDLHEDPDSRKGYYLYCLSKSKTILAKAEEVIHQVRNLGFPLERKMKTFPFQKRNGIVHIPYWASYITQVVDALAFCNYCRVMGISKNVVVTETPTCIPIKRRVELQLLSIRILAE